MFLIKEKYLFNRWESNMEILIHVLFLFAIKKSTETHWSLGTHKEYYSTKWSERNVSRIVVDDRKRNARLFFFLRWLRTDEGAFGETGTEQGRDWLAKNDDCWSCRWHRTLASDIPCWCRQKPNSSETLHWNNFTFDEHQNYFFLL